MLSICVGIKNQEVIITPDYPVAENLKSLHKEYNDLVKNIKSALRKVIDNGTLELIDISDYLGEYFRIEGLTDATDIPKLFQRLWPYYSYLDVEVLEVIVDNEDFLINEKIQKDICTYKQHLKEFKQSTTLEKFKNAVTEALIPNPEVTSITCEVVIKLNREWGKKTLENFKTLVNYMFHQRLTHIRVEEGSICVTLLVPRSRLDFILEIATLKKHFASHVGIFELTINDQPILKEKEETQFSFDQTLQEASRLGNNEAVQFLLDLIDNINYQNEEGRTALMLASKGGHEQVVQTLVSAGTNPNIQDNNGYTALMLACDTNSYNMVNYLLQTGANSDIQRDNGDTAIIIACRNNHSDIVKLLLQFNADPLIITRNDDTALTVSVHVNSIEIVEMLLDKQPENQKASLVVTALTTACRYGHSQLIISLLVHLLDYFTEEEFQLFVLSAEGDHISTTSHIFDSTVDVNCRLVNDITPLMIASSCGHTETVEVLLQAGANVNNTDIDRYSPLVYAITGHKSLQVIEQLLKAGAQPNVFINDQSIADKVKDEGRKHICKLLEQFNVLNTIQKEKEEEQQLQHSSGYLTIPIIEAAKIGNTEVVKLLIKENADVNVQDEDGWTALLLASLNGHTQVVELLIKENADVNIQKKNGVTALMLASVYGHTQVVELLIKENADVKIQSKEGVTALMLASLNGHTQVVELLLKQNADVNIQNENGWTALMLASQNGHTQIVELLLQENTDVNAQGTNGENALMMAVDHGHTKIAELLLKKIENINTQDKNGFTALIIASKKDQIFVVELLLKENADVNIQNKEGVTALMIASGNGYTQVVELLLKENADVNIQKEDGWTALMKASENGHTQIVELLLKENADANKNTKNGCTALMAASQNGHTQVVELLLQENTDVNVQGTNGENALMMAVDRGHTQIAELLLKKVENVNAQDKNGFTALMIASIKDQIFVAELLLKKNADVNIQNKEGVTALMLASQNGHTQVVELLLKENADVNIQDEDGWTALTVASLNGHTKVVELLLKENADVNIQNKEGVTALMLASKNDHTQVIELLLKENADVNIQDVEGATALMAAIENEHSEVVECLLQSKADPYIVAYIEGVEVTALLLAVCNGNTDIVKVLIDNSEPNTDEIEKTVVISCLYSESTLITFLSNKLPYLTNDQIELLDSCVKGDLGTVVMKTLDSPDTPLVLGLTPLMVASSYGHDDIVEALIQAGANVNKQESYYGLTPLCFAVSDQFTSIVEMLLENGANPNVIAMNKTPLDVANESENETIFELLIKYEGQTASHLRDTKQSSEQTIKSSSQTPSETMTIATSSLTTSELTNEANKKQTKRKRVSNFKSIFRLFTSHISNPTHTFKDISVKQDNKKKIKQNNKEEGQEDYLIPIIS